MLKYFWHKKIEGTKVLCTRSKITEKQSAHSPDGAILPDIKKSHHKKGFFKKYLLQRNSTYSLQAVQHLNPFITFLSMGHDKNRVSRKSLSLEQGIQTYTAQIIFSMAATAGPVQSM